MIKEIHIIVSEIQGKIKGNPEITIKFPRKDEDTIIAHLTFTWFLRKDVYNYSKSYSRLEIEKLKICDKALKISLINEINDAYKWYHEG